MKATVVTVVTVFVMAAVICISAILGMVRYANTSLQQQTAEMLLDETVAQQIIQASNQQVLQAIAFIINHDSAAADRFDELGQAVYLGVRRYLSRDLSLDERRLVERIKEEHERLESNAQDAFGGGGQFEIQRLISDAQVLQREINGFIGERRTRRDLITTRERQLAMWTYATGALVIALMLLAIASLFRFLNGRIIVPLRREAEFATDRYAQLVSSINAIVWEADATTTKCSFVSQYAETLLGYPVADWIDNEEIWKRIMHADDYERAMEECAIAVDENRSHVVEYRVVAADGRIFWVRDIVRVVTLEDGSKRLLGVMFNITERVEAEDALRRTEMNLRQAQKMEAIGRLAGGVAHDFNNLLTAIKGYADVLKASLSDPDDLADLNQIGEAAKRAAALTAQLLAFSRKQIQQPEVFDVCEVLSGLQPMLTRVIGEHIDVRVYCEAPVATILADRTQIEQVILNLAVNARDAMPDGGVLTISVRRVVIANRRENLEPGDYITLIVRDTGIGMSAEVVGQIFEPFFTTKELGRGTGLGLSTVYGIVQQSGGSIFVDSVIGAGSVFEAWFPFAQGNAPLDTVDEDAHLLPGSETILLAEDEPSVRTLAKRVLERGGYRVIVAEDGADGLERLRQHGDRIDIIVADIVMPRVSGVDMSIHATRERPGLPIVLMSGYSEQDVFGRIEAIDAEVVFLMKPYESHELLGAVQRALAGHRALAS